MTGKLHKSEVRLIATTLPGMKTEIRVEPTSDRIKEESNQRANASEIIYGTTHHSL